MLEFLLSFVLNVVTSLVDFIMSPFLSALFSLFPSTAVYFNYIFAFLSSGLTYVSTILQWFLFTPSMFVLLFDYYVIKYSIHLITTSVKFALNIYNKLKP